MLCMNRDNFCLSPLLTFLLCPNSKFNFSFAKGETLKVLRLRNVIHLPEKNPAQWRREGGTNILGSSFVRLCTDLYFILVLNNNPERKILFPRYFMLKRLSSMSKISVVNCESGRIQILLSLEMNLKHCISYWIYWAVLEW